jgi:hypothetical protein
MMEGQTIFYGVQAQRQASPAAGSGREVRADAVGSQVQALVRLGLRQPISGEQCIDVQLCMPC